MPGLDEFGQTLKKAKFAMVLERMMAPSRLILKVPLDNFADNLLADWLYR